MLFKDKSKEWRLKWWTEVIIGVCTWHDIEYEFLTPFHVRFTFPRIGRNNGYQLDFFPISGKCTRVGSQRWGYIEDIEVWLEKAVKGHIKAY